MFPQQVFKTELEWIQDEKVNAFATAAVNALPEYFYSVPASSTGKYHPAYATGEGGLVRHTKAAVMFAHELLGLEFWQQEFDPLTRDEILAALILHDGIKHGIPKGNFTSDDHPLVVVNYLKGKPEITSLVDKQVFDDICGMIASHMGQWNTGWNGEGEILPKPKTAAQKFVHMCDYLASRKWLNVDFGDNLYQPSAEPSVQDKVKEIISICRESVQAGGDREALYEIIKKHNHGNRQPNSITDLKVADAILSELKGGK